MRNKSAVVLINDISIVMRLFILNKGDLSFMYISEFTRLFPFILNSKEQS